VPVASRVLETGKYALVVCVNESSSDLTRNVYVGNYEFEVPVEAGRIRLALIERSDGRIIEESGGGRITRLR